jgi:hypothetical protein
MSSYDTSKDIGYRNIKPYVDASCYRELDPVAGTNFDNDKFVVFALTTGPQEYIQIPESPFFMSYQLLNNDTVYKPSIPMAKEAMTADDKAQIAYINSALSGSCFFSHTEITLNGYDFNENSNLGQLQYLYCGLNRFFSNKRDRQIMFGENDAELVDRQSKRNFAKPSKELLCNLKSTEFTKNTDFKTLSFGFDGTLLGPRNYINSCLKGKSVVNTPRPFIPPNSKLLIKLFRTDYDFLRLDFCDTHDRYFTNQAMAVDPRTYNAKLKINKLKLLYKSFKVTQPEMNLRFQKVAQNYAFEMIKAFQFSVPVSQLSSDYKLLLPSHSKVLYLSFCKTHQIYPLSQPTKNQTPKFVFPPFLESVEIELPGHETFGFANGYKGLGEGSYNHLGPREYYNFLLQNRIIDCEYESLFPCQDYTSDKSYMQALVLDLTQKKLSQDTTIDIRVKFRKPTTTALDPNPDKDWNLVFFSVQNGNLTRQGSKYVMNIVP